MLYDAIVPGKEYARISNSVKENERGIKELVHYKEMNTAGLR